MSEIFRSLAEGDSEADSHWVFGTGFEDPLHGVDTAPAAGVDGGALAAYCVALGDDALVAAQRLAEWCANAPELEEEMALANIGLDLIGQTRLLYSRAGQVDGTGRGEDELAYFRDPAEFRNVRLAELPNGDFAFSVARLLVFSAWRLALFERLDGCPDPVLSATAAKGIKELTYHREYAARWVVRLGDGTEESRGRMVRALDAVWPYLGELFLPTRIEQEAAAFGVGVDPASVRTAVEQTLLQVLDAAGLTPPAAGPLPGSGRDGAHTDALVPLVEELQSVAREHPEGVW